MRDVFFFFLVEPEHARKISDELFKSLQAFGLDLLFGFGAFLLLTEKTLAPSANRTRGFFGKSEHGLTRHS